MNIGQCAESCSLVCLYNAEPRQSPYFLQISSWLPFVYWMNGDGVDAAFEKVKNSHDSRGSCQTAAA